MKRRLFLSSLVLAVAAVIGTGSAQAGTVVITDSGNIGQFMATNEGVSGGTATILFAIPNVNSQMNTVNGSFLAVDQPTAVLGPVTLLVTPTGPETYSLALSPATYVQTVGSTPGAQAMLDFSLKTGVAPSILPNFFNMSGLITGVTENDNPALDFSKFLAGSTQNITLTATSYTGATNFAGFLATPGATAIGNGSFSQSAVPEPASFALLGVGLSGMFLLRRAARRRVSKA